MSIIAYALVFAAGIATNAVYNNIRRNGECRAYEDGYKQAQREEAIRKEAMASKRFHDYFRTPIENNVYTTNPAPRFVPQMQQNADNQPKKPIKIDESFMDELHTNGRAVRVVK